MTLTFAAMALRLWDSATFFSSSALSSCVLGQCLVLRALQGSVARCRFCVSVALTDTYLLLTFKCNIYLSFDCPVYMI